MYARFVVLCIIICLSLTVGEKALAQSETVSIEKPLVLVANPKLRNFPYEKSVVVVVPRPLGGHAGVIVNRQTNSSLAKLFPSHEPSKEVRESVFFGGPFYFDSLVAIARSEKIMGPRSLPITGNMNFVFGKDEIDQVIETEPNNARYYAGHVVWVPGELENELKRNLWFPTPVESEIIFSEDHPNLWDKLIQPLLKVRNTI